VLRGAASAEPTEVPAVNMARWFEEEVYPHEPQLRAFLRRQFPTLRDTDDLVQEVYLKILRARRSVASSPQTRDAGSFRRRF
jgi:DNA-directed RNA polymerase specialized sigma24 family protein